MSYRPVRITVTIEDETCLEIESLFKGETMTLLDLIGLFQQIWLTQQEEAPADARLN